MRVIHVVPSLTEAASGPSYSVPALNAAMRQLGVDGWIHTASGPRNAGSQSVIVDHGGWPIVTRLGVSPALRRALYEEAATSDVLHNHSLWMMPNVYPAWAAARGDAQLVVSPRGTLSSWSLRRSVWRKRIMWALAQRKALFSARLIHATSEEEAADCRRVGLRAPIVIAPNGIDVPADDNILPLRTERRQLLFLSRVHPKKGVQTLLEAWHQIAPQSPDWELVIAGPDNDGYLMRMKKLVSDLQIERVTFPGPLHGEDKQAAFRRASLFVLPTFNENFGVAVAEALAYGVPAVVSKGAPWRGLSTYDCGWWTEIGTTPLVKALLDAMACSDVELQDKGRRGREWMLRDFTWRQAARLILDGYEWLLGNGPKPSHLIAA